MCANLTFFDCRDFTRLNITCWVVEDSREELQVDFKLFFSSESCTGCSTLNIALFATNGDGRNIQKIYNISGIAQRKKKSMELWNIHELVRSPAFPFFRASPSRLKAAEAEFLMHVWLRIFSQKFWRKEAPDCELLMMDFSWLFKLLKVILDEGIYASWLKLKIMSSSNNDYGTWSAFHTHDSKGIATLKSSVIRIFVLFKNKRQIWILFALLARLMFRRLD